MHLFMSPLRWHLAKLLLRTLLSYEKLIELVYQILPEVASASIIIFAKGEKFRLREWRDDRLS